MHAAIVTELKLIFSCTVKMRNFISFRILENGSVQVISDKKIGIFSAENVCRGYLEASEEQSVFSRPKFLFCVEDDDLGGLFEVIFLDKVPSLGQGQICSLVLD